MTPERRTVVLAELHTLINTYVGRHRLGDDDRLAEEMRELVDELSVKHFDAGKEPVCQSDADEESTIDFAAVTCPECIDIVRKVACIGCGMSYSDFPLDVVLPRAQWLEIHPAEDGLLCAQCIVKRCAKVPGCTVVHAIMEITPHPKAGWEPEW